MPVLGVDVGSTRMHVAIAHEGQASPVQALDGLPYVPAVVAHGHGKLLVGETARAHVFVAPEDVLWNPARHLGAGVVTLGGVALEPAALVACLLERASAAGQVSARGAIEGMAVSRAAWASPEARRGLGDAAQRAGLNLVRTEVSTTLAAIARLSERGEAGVMLFVDVGGWKIEATVVALEPGLVRALGRSVDPTIGGNWIDGQLIKTLARQVAPANERKLLKDKLCYALLREQCESARIELGTVEHTDLALPFLVQVLGLESPPVWRFGRDLLEKVSAPLVEAARVVCAEAMENARISADVVTEVFVIGGLAHMPALRNAIGSCFGRAIGCRGDVDGMAARGAALAAAASLGQLKLKVVDDLDDRGRAMAAAGWGSPIPSTTTPSPERIPPPPQPEPRPRRPSFAEPATRQPTSGLHPAPRVRVPSTSDTTQPTTPPAPCHVRRPSIGEAPVATATTSPPPLVTRAPPPSTPAPAVSAPAPATSPPSPVDGLPPEGTLKNAADPATLAAVPLEGALPLVPPFSLPVLLLLLGRRRQLSGHLHLRRDQQETVVAIVRGGAAGTSVDMEQLRRAFEWPDGRYQLTHEPPPARLVGLRKPMVSVVVHGVRSWLRAIDIQRVLAVLEPHLGHAPALRPSRAALLPLLGLSPRESRFVEHVLDGVTAADEILRRGGIGRDTAIQLMYVLHLLRAIEWAPVVSRAGESPADRLRQRAQKLEKADHFEALGVHWSVSRGELERALQHHEEELKPGGRTSQLDAEAAARILARVRRAYQAVARPADRHAYLLAIHPDIDFEAIESVTEDQNQWYAWRGAADATQETDRLKHELAELSRLQHGPPKPPS